MKHILKELYFSNKRHFEVWNYLWLMSEDGVMDFSYLDVCARFKVPKSTLARILKLEEKWNITSVHSRIERLDKNHRVLFFDNPTPTEIKQPAPTKRQKVDKRTMEVLEWLKDFYKEKNKDYPGIANQRANIRGIIGKVEVMVKKTIPEATDDQIIENTKLFFNKIPDWWIEKAFTLPSINKNFVAIYDQIKSKKHGKQPTIDSYRKAAVATATKDYSNLTSGS